MVPGAVHAYAIALEAGQFLQAVVEQRGIDVLVNVQGSDGRTIASFDSPNGDRGPDPSASPR